MLAEVVGKGRNQLGKAARALRQLIVGSAHPCNWPLLADAAVVAAAVVDDAAAVVDGAAAAAVAAAVVAAVGEER